MCVDVHATSAVGRLNGSERFFILGEFDHTTTNTINHRHRRHRCINQRMDLLLREYADGLSYGYIEEVGDTTSRSMGFIVIYPPAHLPHRLLVHVIAQLPI